MAIPSRPKNVPKLPPFLGSSEFWNTTVNILVSVVNSSTFKTKLTVYLYRSIPQKNLYLVTKGSFATSKVESVIKIQA